MSFGVCQVDLALSNPLQLFFCLCSLYYFPHWDWSSSFTLDLVFNIAYAFGMEFSCFGLMNAYVWLMIGLCCISFLVVEFFRLWLCFSFSFLCNVIPLWFHSAHLFISMLNIYWGQFMHLGFPSMVSALLGFLFPFGRGHVSFLQF